MQISLSPDPPYMSAQDLANKAQDMLELGKKYLSGTTGDKEPVKAVELFKKAIDLGSHEAELQLARCYAWGEGTERNFYKAKEYYEKASSHGIAKAVHQLALCYANGLGVGVDEQRAATLFKQALSMGHAKSALIFVSRAEWDTLIDRNLLIESLFQLAEKGNLFSMCMYIYSIFSRNEIEEIPPSVKEKRGLYFAMLEKASLQGKPSATFFLAFLYYTGTAPDRPKDTVLARSLMEEAARGGNIAAKIELATRENKIRLPFPQREALLIEAAEAENFIALQHLECLYRNKHLPSEETRKKLKDIAQRIITHGNPKLLPQSTASGYKFSKRIFGVLGLETYYQQLAAMGHSDCIMLLANPLNERPAYPLIIQETTREDFWIHSAAKMGHFHAIDLVCKNLLEGANPPEEGVQAVRNFCETLLRKGLFPLPVTCYLEKYHREGLGGARKDPREAKRLILLHQ